MIIYLFLEERNITRHALPCMTGADIDIKRKLYIQVHGMVYMYFQYVNGRL